MAKISISLPDNTQIVVETDGAELLREVLEMALRGVADGTVQSFQDDSAAPAGSAQANPAPAGSIQTNSVHTESVAAEKGTGVTPTINRPADPADGAPPEPTVEEARPQAASPPQPSDPESSGPESESGPDSGRRRRHRPVARRPEPTGAGGLSPPTAIMSTPWATCAGW